MTEKIQSFRAEYLGGHGMYPNKRDVSLTLLPDEIFVEDIKEEYAEGDAMRLRPVRYAKTPFFHMPLTKIKEIANTSEKKMDAARVIFLGVVGALWKKKETYLYIIYNDGIQDQTPMFKVDNLEKVQQEIYRHVAKFKQAI